MKKLSLVILLSLFSFTQVLWSQEKNSKGNSTVIGIGLDYGSLLRHSESLQELEDAFPVGVGVEWSKMLLTQNAWDFCNCLPRVGLEVAYWSFDNPDILGNGLLAMSFVEPYFRTHKNLNLVFRIGLGGAYLTNPFDTETNPQNLSYSTDLSFALTAGIGLNYRVTNEWSLGLLAKYSHTSNGGVRTPNKGLNFPSINFRIHKSIEPIVFPEFEKMDDRKPPEKKSRVSLMHFSSWSNVSEGDRQNYYVFGLAGQYSRWIGGRSAITVGTEFIFDYARKKQIQIENLDDNFIQAGALIGHEFWLGRVTFSQGLGVYYFNDFRVLDPVYQRYGLTYNFSKQLFAGFNLKAHRHVADFFDLRIGYIF